MFVIIILEDSLLLHSKKRHKSQRHLNCFEIITNCHIYSCFNKFYGQKVIFYAAVKVKRVCFVAKCGPVGVPYWYPPLFFFFGFSFRPHALCFSFPRALRTLTRSVFPSGKSTRRLKKQRRAGRVFLPVQHSMNMSRAWQPRTSVTGALRSWGRTSQRKFWKCGGVQCLIQRCHSDLWFLWMNQTIDSPVYWNICTNKLMAVRHSLNGATVKLRSYL